MIGLACAWRAAQRGARVAVLERAEPPAGATNVAAGMLAPVGELTFGEPELLELTLASARALAASSSPSSRRPAGVATGYAPRGALHVALDRDEAAQLRRRHDLQRSLGLEAEWLAPRALPRARAGPDPVLRRRRPRGGRGRGRPAGPGPGPGRGAARGRRRAADRQRGRRRDLRRRAPGGVARPPAARSCAPGAVVLATAPGPGRRRGCRRGARPPVRPVKGEVVELRRRERRAALPSGSSPPSASTWCRAPTAA